MLEPVSLLTAVIGAQAVDAMWQGVLGNETHAQTRSAVRLAVRAGLRAWSGGPKEINHDIARIVRLAHLAALEHSLDSYARTWAVAWNRGERAKPDAFLDAAAAPREAAPPNIRSP